MRKNGICGIFLSLFSVIGGLVAPAPLLATDAAELGAIVEQWVSIEQQRASLATGWQDQERLVEQQLSLLDAEATEIRRLLAQSSASRDEVETERQRIAEQQSRLETSDHDLELLIAPAAQELLAMEPFLPPPLRQSWAEVELASEPTLEQVIALMRLLEEFESRIVLEEAFMDIDGESTQTYRIYLGISHAWYIDKLGSVGGYGFVGDNGWQWSPPEQSNAHLATNLNAIVDILQNNAPARMVSLPVLLDTARSR